MQVMKTIRSVGLTMLVIVGLMVGAAAVYLIFLSGSSVVPSSLEPAKVVSNGQHQPAQPGANAPEGVAIEALPQTVNVGATMSVIALTNATSRCVIAVDASVVARNAPSVQPKTADDYGTVSWSWQVKPTASVGNKTLQITCSYHGRTAVVQGMFKVEQSGT